MKALSLAIGHYGHPGQQRELNEDSYLVLTTPALPPGLDALFVVADGMGGHQAGEIASQSLVELLDGLFRSEDYRDLVLYGKQHEDYYIVVLKEVLEWANEQLYHLSAARPNLNGMGTTATVVLIAQGNYFWGHVGDSRAYLLREGALRRLTTDHTWVNEQVSAGLLTPEEALVHPRRNVLTQSLAGSTLVRVERGMETLSIGDRLLLCSDGLNGVVWDDELREILSAEDNPQHVCERLGALANQRGGPDNITVLAAYVDYGQGGQDIPLGRVLGPVSTANDGNESHTVTEAFSGIREHHQRGNPHSLLVGIKPYVLLGFGAFLSGLGIILLLQLVSGHGFSLVIYVVLAFMWGAVIEHIVAPQF